MVTVALSIGLFIWEINYGGSTFWSIFWAGWAGWNIFQVYRHTRRIIVLGKVLERHLTLVEEIESHPVADEIEKSKLHRITNITMLVMDRGNEEQREEIKELIDNEI